MTTVAVALSGGIDSSVAAYLLKKEGYNVIGITGVMYKGKNTDLIVQNAKSVAKYLDIKHYIVDVSKDFDEKVLQYFDNSYKNGLTPNPCVLCNKFIKWGTIFNQAINQYSADYIATGHYANIKKVDNYYKLYPAMDSKKDQLYFLYQLNQYQLSKTLFPLSKYKKEDIRKIAIDNNLPTKSSKESQDICFIEKPLTTKKYLLNKFKNKEGNFIDIKTNKILGKHDGYFQYTIGQRKGIGIAAPKPLYVVDIDADKNIVFIGSKDDIEKSQLILKDFQQSYPLEEKEFNALVKIRYNMFPVKAKVLINENNTVTIDFLEKINSVARGQFCILYDINDGHLLGGSVIS